MFEKQILNKWYLGIVRWSLGVCNVIDGNLYWFTRDSINDFNPDELLTVKNVYISPVYRVISRRKTTPGN